MPSALPIVLLHGYSSESKTDAAADIRQIYGSLPEELRQALGSAILPLNLGRYITLEDGITLDDLARAMDQALRIQQPELLEQPASFNIITHSTGALVARRWLLRHSSRPSPCARMVHLAGALFGSGWAHVGKGQLARWARLVFSGGAESGTHVLQALDFGDPGTLDLHLALTQQGSHLWRDLAVREACICGSQSSISWLPVPIRYIKEDGADGVVRVAAANSNFIHAIISPTARANQLRFDEVAQHHQALVLNPDERLGPLHNLLLSLPGDPDRPITPTAIAFHTAHGGDEMGIVSGKTSRAEVMPLLKDALSSATDDAAWLNLAMRFEAETVRTYERVAAGLAGGVFDFFDPREQYDQHAMLIFRLRDQDGRPVNNFDIYMNNSPAPLPGNAAGADPDSTTPMSVVFEDHYRPDSADSPGTIVFYLRATAFDDKIGGWADRVAAMGETQLQILATEPETDSIAYLPVRLVLSPVQLGRLIQPSRTTIIDVTIRRVPGPGVFTTVKV